MNPNVKILIEALQNIQSYDRNGKGVCCPSGCTSPDIARKALVDFSHTEYAETVSFREFVINAVKVAVDEGESLGKTKREKNNG